MEDNWVCPQCGGQSRHFSSHYEKYVCDACGYVLLTENDRRKQEQYTRSIIQAKKHLQVGNWDACSSIVRPMLNEYPTDTVLYLLLLASLTQGYDDYLLGDDIRRRTEAANDWDKLERLHSVNLIMQRYANSRAAARRNMLNSRISISAALIAGIVIGFLVSGAMASGMAMTIVAVCGFFAVKKIVNHIKPFAAIKELARCNSSNPFK